MALKISRNLALLYGIMLGDGCLSKFNNKKIIFIAGSLADDIPFFNNVIQPVLKKLINREINFRYRPKTGSIHFHFSNILLFEFLVNLGFPIGKKGNGLFIPKVFYYKNLIKYVLQGFFATDGSLVLTNNNGILYPRVEANGIALGLIKEISVYLNLKGLNCNLYEALRKENSPSSYPGRQTQYRIQINGKSELKKFIKEVGFVNPKHLDRLNNYYGSGEN